MSVDSREVAHAIRAIDPDRCGDFREALETIRASVGAINGIVYIPVPGEEHWDLSLNEWVGKEWEGRAESLRSFVRACGTDAASFAVYDPYAVEIGQRNRMLSESELSEHKKGGVLVHNRLYNALRISERNQVRALLCEGPRLLAWVGVVSNGPLRKSQRDTLNAIVEPLRNRLLLATKISADSLQKPLLEELLLHMTQPLFVLRKDGRVEVANRAGDELMSSEQGRAELSGLRTALRSGALFAGYTLVPLRAHGLPDLVLALRSGAMHATAHALAKAHRLWNLAPRTVRVFEQLCEGLSNKEIAQQLGCSEVTVERHIGVLFRYSGARSRADLVARLHRL